MLRYLGAPHTSGVRFMPGNATIRWLCNQCAQYFKLDLIKCDDERFDPKERFVMGYHPHGILPARSIFAAPFVCNGESLDCVCLGSGAPLRRDGI